MDESTLNKNVRITVNYFPIVTITFIAINFLVFFVVNAVVSSSGTITSDKAVLQCLQTNYPQCLSKVNQKEYIQCGTDLVMQYNGISADKIPFELCRYGVSGECKVDAAVVNKCYPLKNNLYYKFALTPTVFGSGHKPWTIVTSMFLHVSFSHIFNNMIALFLAGIFVETRIGNSKKFLLLYLLAGIVANLFYLLLNQGSTVPALGASGAIFGLLGANLVLDFFKTKINFVPTILGRNIFVGFSVPYLIIIFVMQIFGNLSGETGIAYVSHIGGFIAGIIFIFYLKKTDDIYTPQPIR